MFQFCLSAIVLISFTLMPIGSNHSSARKVKQPREVIEAYKVCNRYYEVFAPNFDFDRAFEETFTRSTARRREIAITDGEFGDLDYLDRIDTDSLVSAYKSRMKIVYLVFPLFIAETKQEEALFFPPAIGEIIERKPPKAMQGFNAYLIQLKKDVATLRAHLDRLTRDHPPMTEQMRKVKDEWKRIEVPTDHLVEPLTSYSRGHVLGVKEPYYRIGNCSVIREKNQMRLIGIKVFELRLF